MVDEFLILVSMYLLNLKHVQFVYQSSHNESVDPKVTILNFEQ
jgi:hypothetical protein